MFSTKILSKDIAHDLDLARRGALDNARQLEQCRAAETMYETRIARLEAEHVKALVRERAADPRASGSRLHDPVPAPTFRPLSSIPPGQEASGPSLTPARP